MKYLGLIITVILLGLSVKTYSQLSAGPEIGVNIIPLGKTYIKHDYDLGLHAGIAAEYRFNDYISLTSGLFYDQKKKTYASEHNTSFLSQFSQIFDFFGIDDSFIDSLVNLAGINDTMYEKTNGMVTQSYIELPVLFNAQWKNVNIFAGPYVAVMVAGRYKEETVTTAPFLQAFDISSFDSTGLTSFFLPAAKEVKQNEYSSTELLNLFDYGVIAGLGYTADKFKFNVSYNYGFPDYRKDRGSDKLSTHQSVRVSVSYMFGLTKKKSNIPSNDL
jgi:hypothetical protein